MITSVFGGTIALSGAGSATTNPTDVDLIDVADKRTGVTADLTVSFEADGENTNTVTITFGDGATNGNTFSNGFGAVGDGDVTFEIDRTGTPDSTAETRTIDSVTTRSPGDGTNELEVVIEDQADFNDGDLIQIIVEDFKTPDELDDYDATINPKNFESISTSSETNGDKLNINGIGPSSSGSGEELAFNETVINEATEYAEGDDTKVEITFDSQVPLNTGSEFNIIDRTGAVSTFDTAGGPNSKTIDYSGGVGNTRVAEINLGGSDDLAGNATINVTGNLFARNTTIDTTSTTVKDSDGSATSTDAFTGEVIGIVEDTDIDTVGDVSYTIDGDSGFFRDRSTGTNSRVAPFNTSGLSSGTYNITFAGEDAAENDTLTLRQFDFNVTADNSSVDLRESEGTATIDATLESNVANREAAVRLFDSSGTEVDNQTATIGPSGEVTAQFVVTEQDEYDIVAEDLDTSVTDSTGTITVGEVTGTASFSESVFNDEKGDVINFTVDLANSDTATVNVGTNASQSGIGYGSSFTVDDSDDGDGQVTVQFNTRDPTAVPTAASDDDEISDFTVTSGSTKAALDVEAYDVTVIVDDEEEDVATLNLNDVSADGFTLYTAPDSSAIQDAENASDITAFKEAGNFSEASTIAFGDYLYHELEVSGIEGMFANASSDDDADRLDDLLTDNSFELNLTISETDSSTAANSDGKELIDSRDTETNLDALENDFGDFHVIADGDADTYYIGFPMAFGDDTEGNTAGLEDGDEFDVTVNVTAGGNTNLVDENVSVTQTFTVENRSVELDTERDEAGDDLINLEPDSGQVVTGTTNLAPGSEIDVRVRATGENPLLLTQTVEVNTQRNYEASFDLSDREIGTEFEVTATGPSRTSETVDALIVESTATETPAPTETATATPEPTATATATATATEEPTATETPGQPGFGIIVALLAFLAAALLAFRRD